MSEEEQIILPDGFKRVEFLQSNGNEVIYTGIIPTDKHGFYAEVESCGGTGYACGTQTAAGLPGHWIYVNNGVLQASYENNIKTTVSTNKKSIIKNNFLNDRKLVSDTSIVKNYSQDFTYNWSYEFTLFKSTYGGNTNFGPVAPIKFYRFKISENEKIIKDFIPCLDINGEPCMYDILGTGTIEENTYYNKGSERFLTDRDYTWNYPLLNNNYNLPYGFKKCVYLQSDGTQWIDTGVAPNNETGLFCKTLKLDNAFGTFFGVRDTSNSSIMTPFMGKNGKSLSYRWKSTSVNDIIIADKAGDYSFSSFLNYYNNRLAKFDSEDTDFVGIISGILENYTHNIWLFSTNFQGSFSTDYGKYRGRICRAQITQGDTLIRDFIPCLDADGRPCMWDSINDVAYYNQSGGSEFTYCVEHQLPSDFLKLKYLESTGTQYIKTGYVPTNTTGLYIDVQSIGNGDTIPMGLRESSSTDTRFFITRQTSASNAGYGWGTWTEVSTTKGNVRYESTLNWLNDRKSITNNPLFGTVIKNLGELSFTPTLDIWMFGINRDEKHAYNFIGRIYRAKISEGSEVVRDFVPAFDTEQQRPCMYDLINAQAFYNEGTGEFDYFPKETNYTSFCQLGVIGNRLGTGEDGLPPTYKRVNYLQSTGTQYIDTGIATDGTYTIRTKMQHSWNTAWGRAFKTVDYDIGGCSFCRRVTNSGYYCMNFWYYWNGGVYGNRPDFTDVEWDINEPNVWEAKEGKNYVLVNGQHTYMRSFNTLKVDASNPNNLTHYIFWANGVFTNGNAKGIMKLYDFQMINGSGKIVLDLIPCLDTKGTPCMFDRIANKTFYNQGTGEFLYG